ncbi:MAG: GNAT family N-acetyltransferase [Pseudomonadota bacterium]
MSWTIHPLTPGRWADFERVMGANGACAGCWCMWWRLKRKDWEAAQGAGNRRAMRRIVGAGPPPGLIGYSEGAPVAWAQICPRADLPTLDRSPVLAPIDAAPVWSLSCFYIRPGHRRAGWSGRLIAAAIDHAAAHGASVVEAYPWDRAGKQSSTTIFTGIASTFARHGFREVARRAPHRPIMRWQAPSS